MTDRFANDDSVTVSGRDFAAITPSDSTDYLTGAGFLPKALYVGGAGNVVVRDWGDQNTLTFTAVPAGTILPIRPRKIMAATTATAIVALL